MPLARIITNAVDESLELSMQLRARGFRVETVAPGKIPTTPADLEVCLDECAPEEIVTRAADADPNGNLWVFVAPGALDDRPRPMRVISLVPQTDLARSSEAKPVRQPAKVIDAVPLASAEDDPILAELESDVILCEQEAANLCEVASEISKVEATASFFPALIIDPIKAVSQPQPAQLPENAKSEPVIPAAGAQAAAASAVSGSFSIPRVPDRPPVKTVSKSAVQPKARPAVYKITFQTGPSFWRAAWVSGALVVLLGILALILEMKPHVPANVAKPASAQSSPSFQSPVAPGTKLPDPGVNLQRESKSGIDSKTSDSHVLAQAAPASSDKTPKSSRHNAARSDDIIAEDTVVFYDRPHRPGSSKIAAQAPPSKYSDQN